MRPHPPPRCVSNNPPLANLEPAADHYFGGAAHERVHSGEFPVVADVDFGCRFGSVVAPTLSGGDSEGGNGEQHTHLHTHTNIHHSNIHTLTYTH